MGSPDRPIPISSGAASGIVDVIRLIVDELGVSSGVARAQVSMGTISINGQMWEGDKLYIPHDRLVNKILIVIGPDRRFVIHYKG